MLRLFRCKMVSVVKWFQKSHFSGRDIDRTLSDFGTGKISVMVECLKWRSNASGVFGKWFTLFKSVNHFPKFTKGFRSNRNHFPVDYYFRPYQTSENAEIIFQKSFYAETNGALLTKRKKELNLKDELNNFTPNILVS
jgi:hypothetical protein